MFSGGVGEYVYGREDRDFGDMGRRLGHAMRQRLDAGALPWPLLPAGECIRATALGASEYSVQLSGNTSTITNPGALLPRRNLQVLQPPYVCERDDRPGQARAGDPRAFHRLRSRRGRGRSGAGAALAGRAVHERIFAFAQGIVRGMPQHASRGSKPLYIMLDGDVAQTLGAILREELGVESEILAIDGVVLWDFDYIDLGRIRLPSMTVPVTIKSLVFSEDPRAAARRSASIITSMATSPPRSWAWSSPRIIMTMIITTGTHHDHHHPHPHDRGHRHDHD